MAGRRIQVQPVVPPQPPAVKRDSLDLLAEFCYRYPQYTFAQARNLPAKDVTRLLAAAKRVDAVRMHNLTNIVAAPYTKEREGVTTMLDHFQGVING